MTEITRCVAARFGDVECECPKHRGGGAMTAKREETRRKAVIKYEETLDTAETTLKSAVEWLEGGDTGLALEEARQAVRELEKAAGLEHLIEEEERR